MCGGYICALSVRPIIARTIDRNRTRSTICRQVVCHSFTVGRSAVRFIDSLSSALYALGIRRHCNSNQYADDRDDDQQLRERKALVVLLHDLLSSFRFWLCPYASGQRIGNFFIFRRRDGEKTMGVRPAWARAGAGVSACGRSDFSAAGKVTKRPPKPAVLESLLVGPPRKSFAGAASTRRCLGGNRIDLPRMLATGRAPLRTGSGVRPSYAGRGFASLSA